MIYSDYLLTEWLVMLWCLSFTVLYIYCLLIFCLMSSCQIFSPIFPAAPSFQWCFLGCKEVLNLMQSPLSALTHSFPLQYWSRILALANSLSYLYFLLLVWVPGLTLQFLVCFELSCERFHSFTHLSSAFLALRIYLIVCIFFINSLRIPCYIQCILTIFIFTPSRDSSQTASFSPTLTSCTQNAQFVLPTYTQV